MLTPPPPPNGVFQKWRPRFAFGPLLLVIFLGVGVSSTVVQVREALLSDSLPRPSPWIDDETRPLDLAGAEEVELSGFLTVAFYDSRLKDQHRTRLVLAVDDGRILPARLFQDELKVSKELTKRLRHRLTKPKYTFGRWKLKDGIAYAVQAHIGYDPERKPALKTQVGLQFADFENVKNSLPIQEIEARWQGPVDELPKGDFVIFDLLKKLNADSGPSHLVVSGPVGLRWNRSACDGFGWWNQWIDSKPELRNVDYLIHPAVSSCPYSSVSLLGVGRVLVNGVFGYSSRQMLHAYVHTLGIRHIGANHRESGDNTCLMGEWWLPSVLTRWKLGWLKSDEVVVVPNQKVIQQKVILHVPESGIEFPKLVRVGDLFLSTDSGALRGPPGFPVLVHRTPVLDGSDGVLSSFYREAVLYHDQTYSAEGMKVRAGRSFENGSVEVFVTPEQSRSPIRVTGVGLVDQGRKFCATLRGSEPGHIEVRTLTTAEEASYLGAPWSRRLCFASKSIDEGFSVLWRGRSQKSFNFE